ncbi:MAG: hypothetical protein Q9174_003419, partial [Haloplaca sp. 1 TL-2023]
MPGVPSGRGCNACRKQKKKINCEGQGEQRWKFVDRGHKRRTETELTKAESTTSSPVLTLVTPPFSPSNSTTVLISALAERINPKLDIKYQLVWNFGGYLLEVPRRLGVNAALDAAADLLVCSHKNYCGGRNGSDQLLLSKHGRALRLLREAITDRVTARSNETLCAVMLLMVTQLLLYPSQNLTYSHSEGAARLLKARGLGDPRDKFEQMLLATLRGPLVLEALINEKINFTKEEWQLLILNKLHDLNIDGEWVQWLARVPEFLQRTKDMDYSSAFEYQALVTEVSSLCERCRANVEALRFRMVNFTGAQVAPELVSHFHTNNLRILALTMGAGIILNRIMSALLPMDMMHAEESHQWAQEINQIQATYKPIPSTQHHHIIKAEQASHAMSSDANDHLLYPYQPNRVLPILFAVIVSLLGLAHFYQAFIRYKWLKFGFMMLWASSVWIAGLICRAFSAYNPEHINLYICQYVMILAGPVLYAASEYFILGRLLAYVPYHTPIQPGRVLSTFLFFSAAVEAITAAGASTVATSTDEPDRMDRGLNLVKAGLLLQAIIELGFLSLVALIEHRCRRSGHFPSKVKIPAYVLYITSIMMLVRCIFRAVEGFQQASCPTRDPHCSAVEQQEALLWVFEAANIALFVAALAVWHPG